MSSAKVINASIFFLLFFLGVGIVFFYTSNVSHKTEEKRKVMASKSAFSLENAPKDSIRGDIVIFSGEVKKESRIATEAAPLIPNTKIQQGEMLQTGPAGSITVNFPTLGEIQLFSQTEISVIQSLPTSFVLTQPTGTVRFTSAKTTHISVRSHHLLANIKGKAAITVDSDDEFITIHVTEGDVTIAYNDIENISQVNLISKGETATYNDETRETTIE